jgi:diguanylate cyclase (GGDEF)-like protein
VIRDHAEAGPAVAPPAERSAPAEPPLGQRLGARWPVAVAVTDGDLVVRHASPGLRRLLGLERPARGRRGPRLTEFLTAPSRLLFQAATEIELRQDRGLTDVLLEFKAADGSTLPVIAAALIQERAGEDRILWAFLVAPRRAEFERRLLASRQELAAFADRLAAANRELAAQKALIEQQAQDLEAQARQLAAMAAQDPLTGVLNRRGLAERVAGHRRLSGALLVIDIDRFKQLNDTRGHTEGDRALIALAEGLRAVALPDEITARIGGDELVLVGLYRRDGEVADLSRRLEPLTRLDGSGLRVSIGLASMSTDTPHFLVDDVVRHADTAMYEAKRAGGGRCSVYRHTPTEADPVT